jgi:hypothetical protein
MEVYMDKLQILKAKIQQEIIDFNKDVKIMGDSEDFRQGGTLALETIIEWIDELLEN